MDLRPIKGTLMRLNAGVIRNEDHTIIVVPKPISDADSAELHQAIPNCEIVLGVKPESLGMLQRFHARCVTNGSHVFIETPEGIPADPQAVWETICRVMSQDGFPTSWTWQDRVYGELPPTSRSLPIDSIDIGLLIQAMDADPTLSFL